MSKPAISGAGAESVEQIPLPFPAGKANYSRESFIIAPSNEDACRAGEAWLRSDDDSLAIYGPQGSGKTHLAHILARSPEAFQDWRYVHLENAPEIVVFDDVTAEEPRGLLAAYQTIVNSGRRVIFVGRGQPGGWAGGLKDLRTRLEAAPRAGLEQPDEMLLRVVMRKAFTDRQIVVSENVIEYAAPRINRNFASAFLFVREADAEAARRKEKISVALARRVIEQMTAESNHETPAAQKESDIAPG